MKPAIQNPREVWHPQPVKQPFVDPEFAKMDGLQRAVESLRYAFLRWEHWASPTGDIREWLRHNTRVGAWLLMPAIFVVPVVGFILWQLTGWLAMLTSIAGRLVVLPILFLLAFVVIRTALASIKR